MKAYKGISDYAEFTEVSGNLITRDQLFRMRHRYSWARENISPGSYGLELCCGSGQGLKILSDVSTKLDAIDVTPSLISKANIASSENVYCETNDVITFLTQIKEPKYDYIVLFECIYFFQSWEEVLKLALASLKPGGSIFITWPNPLKEDFVKCDHTYKYPLLSEINTFIGNNDHKYSTLFFGYGSYDSNSLSTRIKSKLKLIAKKLNLIPKTQSGRILLKRIFQGKMLVMPNLINYLEFDVTSLDSINSEKDLLSINPIVIYCHIIKD